VSGFVEYGQDDRNVDPVGGAHCGAQRTRGNGNAALPNRRLDIRARESPTAICH
jgi:hypothetical protein